MSRLVVVLALFFAIACSQETPTQQSTLDSEVGPWETIEVNGALYRRAAAKPTETGQADLLITIPIGYTVSSGAVRFSDTVTIAGRVYTADCGTSASVQDDVGNTMEAATELTVPMPTSAEEGEFWTSPTYTLTPGDVDYFKLRVTQFLDIGVLSGPDGNTTDTVGKLMTSSGRVIFENDNAEGVEPNFTVWAFGISPGTLYLEVRGATPSTQGDYSLLVGTWLPASAKPVAASARELELIKEFSK